MTRRRLLPVVLAALLCCLPAYADEFWVQAPERFSTRSGPGTVYTDTGTYKFDEEQLQLHSFAYDHAGVCWVSVDVTYRGKLRRVYTGLKSFDGKDITGVETTETEKVNLWRQFSEHTLSEVEYVGIFKVDDVNDSQPVVYAVSSLDSVLEEEHADKFVDAVALRASLGKYGPGTEYASYEKLTIDAGKKVRCYPKEENGYVQIEYDSYSNQNMVTVRCWVQKSLLQLNDEAVSTH